MREAMEVIRAERLQIAETVDGGQASASYFSSAPHESEAKISWNGLVTQNAFEEKVAEHNWKLQSQYEEAMRLKEVAASRSAMRGRGKPSSSAASKLFSAGSGARRGSVARGRGGALGGQLMSDNSGNLVQTPLQSIVAPRRPVSYRPGEAMQSQMATMQDSFTDDNATMSSVASRGPPALFGEGQRVEGNFAGEASCHRIIISAPVQSPPVSFAPPLRLCLHCLFF